MNNEASFHTDLAGVFASCSGTNSDPAILRAEIRQVFAETAAAAPAAAAAAFDSLAHCLEVVRPDSTSPLAAVGGVITKFLVEWEKLAAAAPSVVDIDVPKKILARASDSLRRNKRFRTLLDKVEKALGRPPSKMTITAVVHSIDPDAAIRILRSEENADVVTALIASHGDSIGARVAVQVFKRVNETGLSPALTEAITKLKHRMIVELLPLDTRGNLGQTLSRGLLGAIIKPAQAKVVAGILKNSASRRVIECCLDEQILATESDEEDVAKWLRAFFEGLPKFSSSDSEALCSRLVTSSVSTGMIVDALVEAARPSTWSEHGRKWVVNAALRALSVPELRRRALSLLVRADDLAWLSGDAIRRYEESLAISQSTASEAGDDSSLRWRICDRVVACLERAAEQNYDRQALQAILMGTLGDFGLRTGANAGQPASFDGDIHEITLWSCRQGEPVLLQTDLLRLDDPVTGDVVRKARVIPLAKVNETEAPLPRNS